MSESNQAVNQVQEKQKSFTERFLEMEQTVQNMAFLLQFNARSMKASMEEIDQNITDIQSLRETMAALLSLLSEKGLDINVGTVINKVKTMRSAALKGLVQKELDEKNIELIQAVEDASSILAYETEADGFNYNNVGNLGLDEENQKLLIGKKAGDKVTVNAGKELTLTVVNVYKAVSRVNSNEEQKATEAQ